MATIHNYKVDKQTEEDALHLDDEERQILANYEADLYVSVDNWEDRKQELVAIANNTLKKNRNINLRLTEQDVHRLKVKAMQEGIPYQTLAASILHKAVAS